MSSQHENVGPRSHPLRRPVLAVVESDQQRPRRKLGRWGGAARVVGDESDARIREKMRELGTAVARRGRAGVRAAKGGPPQLWKLI